ncbi:MAG TPA: type IV pilin-like G/H family protein [Oculatellaceae cyanobacterium]
MSDIVFNHRARILPMRVAQLLRLRTSSQLMARGLLALLLGTLGTPISVQLAIAHNAAPKAIAQTVPRTQNPSKIKPVAEQLLGRWQAKDPRADKVFTFIFGLDGKLFVLLPTPNGSSVASKVAYQINPTTQPMQLDMVVSPDEKVLTIFELTPEGKLRVELEGLNPGQPRPTVFSSKSTLFEKISDATTVPENAQIIDNQNNTTAQSNVVKQFMTILIRAQQAYFLEKEKFATDIKELGIISNLETEFYRYQIVPQKDNTQSVAIAAIPKNSQLPSYIGAIFASKANGKNTTATQICETDKPSTSPPAMPSAPATGSSEIQCAAGSRPLR